MNEEKKEILSKLYCIKSGLSAISIEKDKVCNEEKKLNKLRLEIEKNDELITKLNTDIEKEQAEISSLGYARFSQYKKPNIFGCVNEALIGLAMAVVGAPILVIVGSLLIGIILAFSGANTDVAFAFMKDWKIFLYAIIICALITIPVYTYIEYRGKVKNYEWQVRNVEYAKQTNNERSTEHQRNKTQFELQRQETSVMLEKNSKSYKENLVVYADVKNVCVPTANTLYDALVMEYNSLLDSRDWKHLDLIIFYYETGRADTLKEALQQVDRQVQTDTIVKEIKNASKNICATLKNSISNLQASMERGFANLSNQLDIQHKETMGKLDSIDKGIQGLRSDIKDLNKSIKDGNAIMNEISNNMSKISEATYLQNALLEKISVDSMSLVSDANYMIDYKTPQTIVNFKMPEIVNYKETQSGTGTESKKN